MIEKNTTYIINGFNNIKEIKECLYNIKEIYPLMKTPRRGSFTNKYFFSKITKKINYFNKSGLSKKEVDKINSKLKGEDVKYIPIKSLNIWMIVDEFMGLYTLSISVRKIKKIKYTKEENKYINEPIIIKYKKFKKLLKK